MKLGPFSKAYNQGVTQDGLYDNLVPPFIEAFMGGINCTIFLYGQTGSGKTHTLLGPPQFYDVTRDLQGICPKFMNDMLKYTDNCTFHASAVEVYFDDCYDLLNKKAKIPIAG